MKKIIISLVSIMVLLVSFSIASASTCDNFSSSWQQELATEAEAQGLDQATGNARGEGKTVLEIICASLAAGFTDHAIIVALANADTGRAEIVSAAAEAGLNMQIVIAALGRTGQEDELTQAAEPTPATVHPDILAGGQPSGGSVSPAAF